jgi:sugar phosphate isomerase/epimerase
VLHRKSSSLSRPSSLDQSPRWKLSINQMTAYRWSMEEFLGGAAKARFEAVGLWRKWVDDCGVDETRELAASLGLKISTLSVAGGFTGGNGFSCDESILDSLEAIRTAWKLGATTLLVYAGSRGNHTPTQARRCITHGLKEIAPLAEDLGVQLAVVPLSGQSAKRFSFLGDLLETWRLVQEVGSDHLGLGLNSYHSWKDPNLLLLPPEAMSKLFSVQIADSREVSRSEYDQTLPGDGQIPLPGVIQSLSRAGYKGHLDISVWSEQLWASELYDEMLTRCRQRMETWDRCSVDTPLVLPAGSLSVAEVRRATAQPQGSGRYSI